MKHSLLVVFLVAVVVSAAHGGVGIYWTTGWGAYTHDAPNVTDYPTAYGLLSAYSAIWQLVYAGTNDVVDPPGLDNAANGFVSGDDVVWAQRTLPMGGGTAPEDGTAWDNTLYLDSGDASYENMSWSTPGKVFQRVYEGTPASGSYYYDSPLLTLDLSVTNADPNSYQYFYAETDPGSSGFKPDKTTSPSLGVAVDAPELNWSTGGGCEWTPTTYTTHDGVDAASVYIPAYNQSWIETTVTGPIAISFWGYVESPMGGSLNVAIDGMGQVVIDGYSGWQYAACVIPAGTHIVRWTLDGGWNYYMGSGWAVGYLDQVVLSPIAPEIEIQGGNSIWITNGATTASTDNGTDFGVAFLTGSASNRTFAIRNWGTTNLEISAVAIEGPHTGDFHVVAYPATVGANSISNFSLNFDPTALGGRTAVVAVVNNDADEGNYTFTVSGTGIADGPYIRVLGGTSLATPITNGSVAVTNTLGTDFGWQYLTGASTTRTFAVSNAGNATLNISAINRTGAHPGDFSVLSFPATVAAGTRSNLVIQFDPAAIGLRTTVVEVVSDGVGVAAYAFAVGGSGVPDTPEISVLGTNGQAVLDGDMVVSFADGTHFGGVPAFSGSVERVFAVTNSGAANLVVSNVAFQGAGAAHFSALSVPAIVAPGTQSNLLIRFSPAAAGVQTAVVVIANNDVDENPYEFAVRGEGISTHYVWTNSPSPAPPFLTWDTAAQTIQEAANVCVSGDVIIATNGIYNTGGLYYGSNTNRVCITNAVRLCSVNGPDHTFIVGSTNNGIGNRSVRGVYLGVGASLWGFTLTNGTAYQGGGIAADNYSATAVIVSNCIIAGNLANYGGGVDGHAAIYGSVICGNRAFYHGGGVSHAALHRCRLMNNQAGSYQDTDNDFCCSWGTDEYGWPWCWGYGTAVGGGGGGAYDSTLHSCLLEANWADAGGGASFSSLINCTLISNQASGVSYNSSCGTVYGGGGGIFRGSAINCIFVDNADVTVPAKADWDGHFGGSTNLPTISYSCMDNPPSGVGNMTGRASFVAGTYRLAPGSLGIDAGTNASVQGTTDLDGNSRILNGTVDMGAYEYVPQAILPDADGDGIPDDWESAQGLNPAVSNSPAMDADGDAQPDVAEYIADTQPNNPTSVFPQVVVTNPPLGTMVLVVDPTSTARVYGVRWTTNLLAVPQFWTLVPPEKTGTGTAVSFTVTNAGPGRIYRTGVRLP